MSEILLTIAILDYNKYIETKLCLESIRAHIKIPYKLVLLDNGGTQDYPWKFYKDGLCDILISKKNGGGGGFGQTDLFRWCDTKYISFIQNDQVLQYDIEDSTLANFIELLKEYKCIDLNGDQSGRGIWTDRAHFMETEFFNSLGPFPNGGPGENHHLRWNENYLQEVFTKNDYKIAHIIPAYFRDNGTYSIRNMGDGGHWCHRTDNKKLWNLVRPKIISPVFPNFTEEEKLKIMSPEGWPDGQIPEKEIKCSFHCWRQTDQDDEIYIKNLRHNMIRCISNHETDTKYIQDKKC